MQRIYFKNLVKLATLVGFLVACAPSEATQTTPIIGATKQTLTSSPTLALSTDTPLPSTPGFTATPAFDIQRLEGIWSVDNIVFIRHSADGKYSVALDSIKKFLGKPLDGTMTVEGDIIKLYGGLGCSATKAGIYHISLSEEGDRYTLSLIEDPCSYRKGGDIPAANTYHKLEALVLPGIYITEVTQAAAEEAGGEELLQSVGVWELQLNADNKFVILQNGQSMAKGEYLSAGEQFTLEDAEICPNQFGPVVRAIADDESVTFSPDPTWTRGYRCQEMILILTGHRWVKQ